MRAALLRCGLVVWCCLAVLSVGTAGDGGADDIQAQMDRIKAQLAAVSGAATDQAAGASAAGADVAGASSVASAGGRACFASYARISVIWCGVIDSSPKRSMSASVSVAITQAKRRAREER